MNDDISTQLHLAARDNRRAAMAIEALERAQEDANRANEALKSAQDEAKAAQHAAEQSLAALKLCNDEQVTAVAGPAQTDGGTETARIVIESGVLEGGRRLGRVGLDTAANAASSAALDNLNSKMLPKLEADGLTFSIELDAGGGLPRVSISGPCELSATHNRLGVGDIAELAKRAQRALHTPIVDKPKAE